MKCAVANCGSGNRNKACDISFFTFPTDEALAKKWMHFCQRGNAFNPKTSFICMKHFTSTDIANNLKFEMGFAKKRLLKRGVVPTIYTKNVDSQRGVKVQLEENNKDVSELLQLSASVAVNEDDANKENSHMEKNLPEMPSKVFYYESSLQEVQELEAELFVFDKQQIFVFADVPHMLKLLRNHFLDQVFMLKGKAVKNNFQKY